MQKAKVPDYQPNKQSVVSRGANMVSQGSGDSPP